MRTHNATLLADTRCNLGEGIQWHAPTARVYWTDIFGNALWSCDENGAHLAKLPLHAGLCAFAFTDHGDVLAAFTDGLYWLNLDSGARTQIKPYQPETPNTRMNDGGLDRQGRFIVGGINEDGMQPTTPVWRVTPDGVTTVLSDVGCANSIVFSPDGKTMYFADSAGTEVHAYDYDVATGTPTNKRPFANSLIGKPDGSAVDREGALWNARFGGGLVQRFLPDGTEHSRVSVPVPNVTCCCIGGRSMNRLFITTACLAMPPDQRAAMPKAGGLYACDLPVQGLDQGTYATSIEGP